jgi:CheY-like chemotaxis protein
LKRILVIDDDDLVRDTLIRILSRAGYEAIAAKDGREGVARFRESPPDLILTDVIMPDQDGIETIVELRQLAPAIPIIAISGGGRARAMQFLDAAHKLGADKVLSKPIKQADLVAAISELLTKAAERGAA